MADRLTQAEVAARSERNRKAWAEIGNRQVSKAGQNARQQAPGKASGRKRGRGHTDYEAMLAGQLDLAGITGYTRQHKFALERKYRADFYFSDRNLIVEIDGAVHRIKARFKADIERDQVIFFLWIRKLRVSTAQVRSGEALRLVEMALRGIMPYPKL